MSGNDIMRSDDTTKTSGAGNSGLPRDFAVGDYFDATGLSIVVADARSEDQPLVFVNRAFELTTGYSQTFALGRNCRFLQGEDTNPATVQEIAQAISDGREIVRVLQNYRADGAPFANELTITPVRDIEDEVAFFVGVQRVVGDTDADAKEAERAIAVFKSQVMAHVNLLATLPLSKDRSRLGKRFSCLETISHDVAPLGLDEGRADLGAYLSHVASFSAVSHNRSGVTLNTRIARLSAPLEVCARLGLVLGELLDNAFTHAFAEADVGLVEVEVRIQSGMIELTVTDDGDKFENAANWPHASETMGARIVRGLVEPLQAKVGVRTDIGGTVVEIDLDMDACGIEPLTDREKT